MLAIAPTLLRLPCSEAILICNACARRLTRLLLLFAGLLPPGSKALQADTQPLSKMVHRSWSGRDGAPQGVLAMAQTPDGLLWIAGVGGLTTFDGISFMPFRLQEAPPKYLEQTFHFLLVSTDGDLWMFAYHGPPARFHNGKLQVFDRIDGRPIEQLTYPQQAPDGSIWAVLNERQLIQLGADGIWHTVDTPGGGHAHVTMFFIDADDTAWLVADTKLYRQPGLCDSFLPTPISVFGFHTFKQGLNHDLWISSSGESENGAPTRHLQHLDRYGATIPTADVDQGLTEALPS